MRRGSGSEEVSEEAQYGVCMEASTAGDSAAMWASSYYTSTHKWLSREDINLIEYFILSVLGQEERYTVKYGLA